MITQDEKNEADRLIKSLNADNDNRLPWRNKLINATDQRQGRVLIKNWPWPGAAEYTVPFTDKTIKKLKATLVLACINNKKWVMARKPFGLEENPFVREACRVQEAVMNALLQSSEQDFERKIAILIDSLLEKGKFVAKISSKFNVRKVQKTLFVDDFIRFSANNLKSIGQLPPETNLDDPQVVEQFKEQVKQMKNKEIYPFLVSRFGFDLETPEDKKILDDIIRRFKKNEQKIVFKQTEVTQRPDIDPVLPEFLIVPADTNYLQDSPRLGEETWLTKSRLLELAEQGVYDLDVIKGLDDPDTQDSYADNIEQNKSFYEGVLDSETKRTKFRIIHVFSYFKGHPTVFSILTQGEGRGTLIRKPHAVPNEFPELEETVWPFVDHNWEEKDKRYYSSRGIPEMVHSIQEIMDQSFNNMINRDIINNTPMFLLSSASTMSERKVRFVPGQIIREQGAELKRFETGASVDIGSERIAQIAKAYGDEYVGSLDSTLNNAANPGGAKTATEINAAGQAGSVLSSLDALLLFKSLTKIAKMVFSIFKERFERPMTIDGIRVTREHLDVPCELIWNGSLEQADKQLQANKALARAQMTLQAPPSIVNDEDRYNALYDWHEKDGVNDPDRYATRPEEQAKVQINQMQEQVTQAQQELLNQQETLKALDEEIIKAKEDLVAARERVSLEVLEADLELKKKKKELNDSRG